MGHIAFGAGFLKLDEITETGQENHKPQTSPYEKLIPVSSCEGTRYAELRYHPIVMHKVSLQRRV